MVLLLLDGKILLQVHGMDPTPYCYEDEAKYVFFSQDVEGVRWLVRRADANKEWDKE